MELTGTPHIDAPSVGLVDELINYLDAFVYNRMELVELDKEDRELIVEALEHMKKDFPING